MGAETSLEASREPLYADRVSTTTSRSTPFDSSDGGMFEGRPSFSLANRSIRVFWSLSWLLLARWTPPPLHGWRRMILRMFGARIGAGARIYGSSRIWLPANLIMGENAWLGPHSNCYNQGAISIGDRAVISQGAHLCASSHDASDPNFQLILRPIRIDANAWIAAEAFVGPGVTVGEGAVLGARGVAVRNLAPWTIYGGNPAREIKARVMNATGSPS